MQMKLFDTYPRSHPPLPERWQAIYEETYKASRDGGTFLYRLTQSLEAWMHRKVSSAGCPESKILEIGAGTLNHIDYEPNAISYDIIEPFRELYLNRKELCRVGQIFDDIDRVPLFTEYGKILSVAVLEHISNLPGVVARAGLLLNKGGVFCAGIPSEGGFLWGLGWRATVGVVARLKLGLNYGDLMRHEHLSTAPEIIAVVRYFFKQVEVSRFPLPFHHLSLYSCIRASDPIEDRCRGFLHDRSP